MGVKGAAVATGLAQVSSVAGAGALLPVRALRSWPPALAATVSRVVYRPLASGRQVLKGVPSHSDQCALAASGGCSGSVSLCIHGNPPPHEGGAATRRRCGAGRARGKMAGPCSGRGGALGLVGCRCEARRTRGWGVWTRSAGDVVHTTELRSLAAALVFYRGVTGAASRGKRVLARRGSSIGLQRACCRAPGAQIH